MEYRSLGRTGVLVSPLCLGTMNFGTPTSEDESIRILERALAGGINFVDTANVYNAGESERIVGKALRANGKREQIVLATKAHGRMGENPNDEGNSRFHILQACEDSLRRLQTDHIDLYQIHRPSLTVPQDETLRALDDLVRHGKIRYIGCSTHPAWMVMEALATSERLGVARYVSEQPPYNLLDRRIENELIPLALRCGLAILPWSPLAMGMLAGRYPKGQPIAADARAGRGRQFAERVSVAGQEVAERLAVRARERNLTAAQLALLWCKDQPGITAPIMGPRTLAQLEDQLAVLNLQLVDEDRGFCDTLVHPGNAVADFHNTNPWMKARIM